MNSNFYIADTTAADGTVTSQLVVSGSKASAARQVVTVRRASADEVAEMWHKGIKLHRWGSIENVEAAPAPEAIGGTD